MTSEALTAGVLGVLASVAAVDLAVAFLVRGSREAVEDE